MKRSEITDTQQEDSYSDSGEILPYLFTETLKQVSNIPSHLLQEFILICIVIGRALQLLDGAFGGGEVFFDLPEAPGVGAVASVHLAEPADT